MWAWDCRLSSYDASQLSSSSFAFFLFYLCVELKHLLILIMKDLRLCDIAVLLDTALYLSSIRQRPITVIGGNPICKVSLFSSSTELPKEDKPHPKSGLMELLSVLKMSPT